MLVYKLFNFHQVDIGTSVEAGLTKWQKSTTERLNMQKSLVNWSATKFHFHCSILDSVIINPILIMRLKCLCNSNCCYIVLAV